MLNKINKNLKNKFHYFYNKAKVCNKHFKIQITEIMIYKIKI